MEQLKKELCIVNGGISEYMIVIPQNPSEVEEYAAEEVRTYLRKATNTVLPIVEETGEQDYCIYVGHTNFADRNGITGDSEENWKIAVCENNVILTGGLNSSQRGITYAAYHFLEDYVGIRWWNFVEEYVPVLTELKLDAELFAEGTPAFRVRKVVDSWAQVDYYSAARSRMNVVGRGDGVVDKIYNSSVRKTGGAHYVGAPSHTHTLELYFPVEEYFKEHSEWWGWDAREERHRDDFQFCLSDEGFFQAVLKKLLLYIRREFEKAEKYEIEKPWFYSISISDTEKHCQCPQCTASVEKSGRSGHNLKFVNRLARMAAEKYPEVVLCTLAYWDYFEPPIDETVPEANVYIEFADMFVDVAHDITYPTNSRKLELLQKWIEVCKKTGSPIGVWDYQFHDYPNFPMPNMFTIPVNYRMYHELGISSCFMENEVYALSDFWCCNQWLLCKYMENPYLDFEVTLNDFLDKYYGAAAGVMREYLNQSYQVMQNSGQRIMLPQTSSNWNYVTPELIYRGLQLFEEAYAAVGDDALIKQRLREAEVSLYRCIAIRRGDLVRSMKLRGEVFELPTVKEAAQKVLTCLDELMGKYLYYIRDTAVHADQFILRTIKKQKELFTKLLTREDRVIPIPNVLKGVAEEDIYQIPANHIVRFFETQQSLVTEKEDVSSEIGTVLRYKASVLGFTEALVDNSTWRLPIILETDNEPDRKIMISKADLEGGEYKWFSMKNISDVCHGSNSCLYVLEKFGLTIKLNPIKDVFPFDSCDIYVSVKAEGHSFGGGEQEENAICFERFVIVRHNACDEK